MEFDLSIWINKARRVREIGLLFKKAADGEHVFQEGERKKLQHEQDSILASQSQYLNACGFPHPKILWRYNPKDESTWASSKKFAYAHLLTYSPNTSEERL